MIPPEGVRVRSGEGVRVRSGEGVPTLPGTSSGLIKLMGVRVIGGLLKLGQCFKKLFWKLCHKK